MTHKNNTPVKLTLLRKNNQTQIALSKILFQKHDLRKRTKNTGTKTNYIKKRFEVLCASKRFLFDFNYFLRFSGISVELPNRIQNERYDLRFVSNISSALSAMPSKRAFIK